MESHVQHCIIHPEMIGAISVVAAADFDGSASAIASQPVGGAAQAGASELPVAAGLSGASGTTEAAITVILLLVLLTVGFIVFLVHEVDFAPATPEDAMPSDDQG